MTASHHPIALLRLGELVRLRGRGRTATYGDITRGVLPPPVHIGSVSVWPADEIDAVTRAVIAGWRDDQIRELVQRLVAERQTLPARVGIAA